MKFNIQRQVYTHHKLMYTYINIYIISSSSSEAGSVPEFMHDWCYDPCLDCNIYQPSLQDRLNHSMSLHLLYNPPKYNQSWISSAPGILVKFIWSVILQDTPSTICFYTGNTTDITRYQSSSENHYFSFILVSWFQFKHK